MLQTFIKISKLRNFGLDSSLSLWHNSKSLKATLPHHLRFCFGLASNFLVCSSFIYTNTELAHFDLLVQLLQNLSLRIDHSWDLQILGDIFQGCRFFLFLLSTDPRIYRLTKLKSVTGCLLELLLRWLFYLVKSLSVFSSTCWMLYAIVTSGILIPITYPDLFCTYGLRYIYFLNPESDNSIPDY